MKKAVMIKPGEMRIEETAEPIPGEGEVLIKVGRVGICGSDLHIWQGILALPTGSPIVQGHEMSGEIADPGGSKRFQKKDRVVVSTYKYCGACDFCLKGEPTLCKEMQLIGVHIDGCAAEYISLPEYMVHKIPDRVTDDDAALIEPFTVGVHACNAAGSLEGKNVLVIGAGVIGNVTAQAAKAKGAARVAIAGRTQYRLDVAKKTGIEYQVNDSEEDLTEAARRIFGDLPDVVFEAIGATPSINSALAVVKPGGTVVIEGLFGEETPLALRLVQEKALHVIGSKIFNDSDMEETIRLFDQGRVNPKPLITAFFPLASFADAYAYLEDKSNKQMKILLNVTE